MRLTNFFQTPETAEAAVETDQSGAFRPNCIFSGVIFKARHRNIDATGLSSRDSSQEGPPYLQHKQPPFCIQVRKQSNSMTHRDVSNVESVPKQVEAD